MRRRSRPTPSPLVRIVLAPIVTVGWLLTAAALLLLAIALDLLGRLDS